MISCIILQSFLSIDKYLTEAFHLMNPSIKMPALFPYLLKSYHFRDIISIQHFIIIRTYPKDTL